MVMLSWFSENIASIIILLILIAIIALVVWYLIRKHKKGSSCGCDCGGACSYCHTEEKKPSKEEVKKDK